MSRTIPPPPSGFTVIPPPPSGFTLVDAQRDTELAKGPKYEGVPMKGVDTQSLAADAVDAVTGLVVGGAKGVYSTGLGLSKLAGAVPQSTTLNDIAAPFSGGKKVIGEPRTGAERFGFNTEQAAEYLLPQGAAGKAAKGVEALAAGSRFPRLAGTIGKAAVEGVASGLVAGAQSGSTDEAKKAALIAGGVTAAVPAVLATSKAAGKKIEKWLMNASAADRANGFDVKNIFKYDVGGNLQQTWQKTEKKLNDLTGMLQASLKGSPGNIKLGNAALRTLNDFKGNPQAQEALERIAKRVEFDLNKRGIDLGKGVLNVAEANIAKQAIGDLGAWMHTPAGTVVSDADRVTEEVANKFYGHLKRDIEAAAVGPVKDINKSISELMAIRQATLRRLPVVDRQAALSLGDLFALSSGKPGISLLQSLSKSGTVANAMVKGAESAAPLAPLVGRAAAAATTDSQKGKR